MMLQLAESGSNFSACLRCKYAFNCATLLLIVDGRHQLHATRVKLDRHSEWL